ncbi:MAG: hypothetical protein M3Q24_02690 [bacterium]|nr:hypothetical protein [bacterium]
MTEESFNKYEMAKMVDQIQAGGVSFERDLPLNRKMVMKASSGTYIFETKEDGLYASGDAPLSDEPRLIKLFGIPKKETPSEIDRMDSNYVKHGDNLEILLIDEEKEVVIGPILEFELLPEGSADLMNV